MNHYGVGHRVQRAEVHAEDFSAYLDLTSGRNIELYESQMVDGRIQGHGQALDGGLNVDSIGGYTVNETNHFVDCILNDTEPWSTLDDAIHTMRLCEAILNGHQGTL